MRSRRRLRIAVVTVLAIVTGSSAVIASANEVVAGRPGSLINYAAKKDPVTLKSITFGTTVTADPGRANVFFASNILLTDDSGGYVGMMRSRIQPGAFLFSIWNATSGVAGSPGTYCEPFAEDGAGYHCALEVGFVAQHHYTFTVTDLGSGAIRAQVRDLTTGTGFTIGTLYGPTQRRLTSQVANWTEYFDGAIQRSACTDAAYSKSIFDVPRGVHPVTGSTVGYTITSATTGQYCSESIVVKPTHSQVRNGIGNSASDQVVSDLGDCLTVAAAYPEDSDGAQVVVMPCAFVNPQNFVFAYDATMHAAFHCVTSTGDLSKPIIVATCTGAANQQWTSLTDGTVRQVGTDLCLASLRPAGVDPYATAAPCDGSSSQHWTAPLTVAN